MLGAAPGAAGSEVEVPVLSAAKESPADDSDLCLAAVFTFHVSKPAPGGESKDLRQAARVDAPATCNPTGLHPVFARGRDIAGVEDGVDVGAKE